MGRHIVTLGHVAHVAQITVIHHFPIHLSLVDTVKLHGLGFVDGIEQGGKGVAQTEAAAAAVADIEDTVQFLEQRTLVIEFGIAPIQGMAGGRLQTAFTLTGR